MCDIEKLRMVIDLEIRLYEKTLKFYRMSRDPDANTIADLESKITSHFAILNMIDSPDFLDTMLGVLTGINQKDNGETVI